MAARIHVSSCALQLEKSLLAVKETRLYSLLQEQQGQAGFPSSSMSPGSTQLESSNTSQGLPRQVDPTLARLDNLASRKAHLQVFHHLPFLDLESEVVTLSLNTRCCWKWVVWVSCNLRAEYFAEVVW